MHYHPIASDESEFRLSSCQGKERFSQFGRAKFVADKINRRDSRARVAPYTCDHCGSFHVGRSNSDIGRGTRR